MIFKDHNEWLREATAHAVWFGFHTATTLALIYVAVSRNWWGLVFAALSAVLAFTAARMSVNAFNEVVKQHRYISDAYDTELRRPRR